MTSCREHRSILRHFSALIVILVSATLLLLVATLFFYSAERHASERIEGFHLRNLVLLGEIEARIVDANHDWPGPDRDWPNAEDPLALAPPLTPLVDSTGQALAAVAALHETYDEEAYRRPLRRVLATHERLIATLEASPLDEPRHHSALASLGFAVHQLQRLHALAAEKTLSEISAAREARVRQLPLMMVLLVVVTGGVVTRLFFLVRKKLEEQLATARALRESQVQLLQAQKLEALGTLVGGIAHDFNNVLTAILGNAECLLLALDERDPSVDPVQQIQSAGERAAAMTRRLLLFSRQQADEPSVVDIGPMMRDLAPLLRRLLREDICLELELEDSLGRLRGDPVQIEQVLINLSVNARDAMPAGGTLTIRARTCEIEGDRAAALGVPPGSYQRISAADTGEGMSESIRTRVFEPFYTTKSPGEGTGLGLSIVHGIVTRAGGRVLVESVVGRGTTFDVYLPCCEQPSALPSEPETVMPPGGSETVLLVEDEEAVRHVAVTALRNAGYQVVASLDAAEALRHCRMHGYTIDLVLTDVVMPDMRGTELVRRVRSLCPHAAVVYMSGYIEEDILEEVEASDAPFLQKPFRLHKLLDTVRETLDARQARALSTSGPRSAA